ncbi:hypothetical protein D6825_01010 [Candidatus Woesearchaeota archaeon]|nr:MAG: hypothetical protein D6825_01010 [Candidatus Woesearchaeota archaeon]
MKLENVAILAILAIIAFSIGAILFVQKAEVTGNLYYERGSTAWAPRVVPSNCAFPATCKSVSDQCPQGWMLYSDGVPSGCANPSINVPDCHSMPASWGGHRCNSHDPNTKGRCVCV